jgi:hypothetical protein
MFPQKPLHVQVTLLCPRRFRWKSACIGGYRPWTTSFGTGRMHRKGGEVEARCKHRVQSKNLFITITPNQSRMVVHTLTCRHLLSLDFLLCFRVQLYAFYEYCCLPMRAALAAVIINKESPHAVLRDFFARLCFHSPLPPRAPPPRRALQKSGFPYGQSGPQISRKPSIPMWSTDLADVATVGGSWGQQFVPGPL